MRKVRGFTLIEVLVVVGIIALLLSIMMPSLKEVRRISRRTVCLKNLDSVGIAMLSYLHRNNDTFPWACRLPSWAPHETPVLPPIHDVLRNEIKGAKAVFCCPSDQNTMSRPGDSGVMPGDEIPADRYYDYEHTSYEWESRLNGVTLGFKWTRIYVTSDDRTKRLEIAKVPKNNMWMMFDFEAFHGGKTVRGAQNILYTDMHADSDKWNKDKKVGQALSMISTPVGY